MTDEGKVQRHTLTARLRSRSRDSEILLDGQELRGLQRIEAGQGVGEFPWVKLWLDGGLDLDVSVDESQLTVVEDA